MLAFALERSSDIGDQTRQGFFFSCRLFCNSSDPVASFLILTLKVLEHQAWFSAIAHLLQV